MTENNFWCHSSSIVEKGATIGANTKIWHFSHIMPKAKIGENCNMGQNVFIADNVIIGNGVKIQNNVSLYEGTVCEDAVFIGPSAVFTNIKIPRSEFPRRDQYSKTTIRHGVSIGANATIVCGIELGRYSMIAAGAVVTKTTKPFSLMAGVPAVQIGWVSRAGHRLDLESGSAVCPETNEHYVLKNSELTQI